MVRLKVIITASNRLISKLVSELQITLIELKFNDSANLAYPIISFT